jgi:hypothetical protein
MFFHRIAFASALALSTVDGSAQVVTPDAFPEGRWTGSLATRTIPDVDKDGEWQQEVALVHCQGQIRLQKKKDDGTYTEGFELAVVPFRRMFVLAFLAVEHTDAPIGWVESQIWTLVDARPRGWTLSQSRAVFNQDMKPESPWYTFRWLALGTMEFDPNGCAGIGAK